MFRVQSTAGHPQEEMSHDERPSAMCLYASEAWLKNASNSRYIEDQEWFRYVEKGKGRQSTGYSTGVCPQSFEQRVERVQTHFRRMVEWSSDQKVRLVESYRKYGCEHWITSKQDLTD